MDKEQVVFVFNAISASLPYINHGIHILRLIIPSLLYNLGKNHKEIESIGLLSEVLVHLVKHFLQSRGLYAKLLDLVVFIHYVALHIIDDVLQL